MRASFARYDLVQIQRLRQQRARMVTICALFRDTYTRDQIVEAIDALRRSFGDADEALQRTNTVFAAQAAGIQLINGKPQKSAIKWEPMFT